MDHRFCQSDEIQANFNKSMRVKDEQNYLCCAKVCSFRQNNPNPFKHNIRSIWEVIDGRFESYLVGLY